MACGCIDVLITLQRMKQLIFVLAILMCTGRSVAQTDSIAVFSSIDEMKAAKTSASVAVVKEPLRGGIFLRKSEKMAPDDGVVFKCQRDFWVRQYTQDEGVDIAWFGPKPDSTGYEVAALKNALRYDKVNITNRVKISGKQVITEGKTINIGPKGRFVLADSSTLQFDGFLKTEDYSIVFEGGGHVVFGTRSIAYVSVCWFGAKSDNSVKNKGRDNSEAIQRAIEAAEKVSDIYLPPNEASTSYRITHTITIEKRTHFFSLKFHGGGTTITNGGFDRATTIFADFGSGPAINIQGSRRSYISDLRIIGTNMAVKNLLGNRWISRIYGQPAEDTASYFKDKDVAKSYAGIATDAVGDSKVWSADIQFDNLEIEQFYVGLSINDAGNLQGDRMRVSNCQINFCTYGISVGNPQARACRFDNVDMDYDYIGYTNNIFGKGTGSEFQITGGQYCNLYKLFHIQPYNLGQCVADGLYAEGIGSIGDIGSGGPHDNSFIFTGCCFLINDKNANAATKTNYAGYYTLTAFGNVSFTGCNFWNGRRYIAFRAGDMNTAIHPAINLSGCTFYRSEFLHGWGNVNIDNCHFTPGEEQKDMNRVIRVRMDSLRKYYTGNYAATVIPMMDAISTDSLNPASAMQVKRTMASVYALQDGKAITITDTSRHDTITLSYPPEMEQSFFKYVMPGDVLGTPLTHGPTQWDNPNLRVTDVDHTHNQVTAQYYTEAFTLDKLALYTKAFFTTQPVLGDAVSGSEVIVNTKNESLLSRGDFITFGDNKKTYRIASVDPTAHTITLMDKVSGPGGRALDIHNLQLYTCP